MRTKITQVIAGIRYDTEKAVEIASNEFWDGHNYERGGRNKHLYKTKKGNFFVGYSTQFQGEQDYVEPVSESKAMQLYEELQTHNVEYEDVFDVTPEEA